MRVCCRRLDKSTRENVRYVGFNGKVRAKLMDLDVLERRVCQFGRNGKGNAVAASDFGGIEKNKFVNDARGESSAVKGWPGFKENAENFPAAEFCENGAKINSTVLRSCTDDFDASVLQSTHCVGSRCSSVEYENIVA